MIKLFEIIENELVFLRDEALMIKEFKAIWNRVRSMSGDNDGRKKKLNMLELQYVQKMGEALYDSNLYVGFSDKEKHERIVEDFGFPDGWKPDDAVVAAVKKYIDIQLKYSPSINILRESYEALMLSGSAINMLKTQVEGLVSINRDAIEAGLHGPEEIAAATEVSKAVVAITTDILKLSKEIPTSVAKIQAFEASIREEIGKKGSLKSGGKEIGLFENPM